MTHILPSEVQRLPVQGFVLLLDVFFASFRQKQSCLLAPTSEYVITGSLGPGR